MIELAVNVSFCLLGLAAVLVLVRMWRGPTLADRILALDSLTTLGVGLIAVFAVHAGLALYLDLAIALALVSFVSTAALARYLLLRGNT